MHKIMCMVMIDVKTKELYMISNKNVLKFDLTSDRPIIKYDESKPMSICDLLGWMRLCIWLARNKSHGFLPPRVPSFSAVFSSTCFLDSHVPAKMRKPLAKNIKKHL